MQYVLTKTWESWGGFQDQFKAVLVENNEQLLWTSYYIHKNPTEADIVINLKDYKWGSYSEYLIRKIVLNYVKRYYY